MRPSPRRIDTLILLLLTAGCIFLTLNFHSRSGIGNYKSEIFSDKAGYYIYLPATFSYGFDGTQVPDSIVATSGKGFFIQENGRIQTKYTYGVALLQLPFYLIGRVLHAAQNELGLARQEFTSNSDPDSAAAAPHDNPFSPIHHKLIDLAAVAYLILGLILLFHFLRRFASRPVVYLTLAALFFGTGLFHYSLKETGMSHVYSFAAFSGFLLALARYGERQSWQRALILGLAAGLIIALRPINILLFPGVLLLVPAEHKWKPHPGHMALIAAAVLLLFLPQMAYWYYLTGNPFHYSYEGEYFDHLLNPQLFKIWFAAQNSLFIWTPLWILILAGMFASPRQKPWTWLLYFLFLSYVFASWQDWKYGCAFGSRPYVEYLAAFSLPLLRILGYAWERRQDWVGCSLIGFSMLAAGVNLKLFFAFDGCWYSTEWDWKAFFGLLF